MADFILFQQPNGEWAKIAVTLDEQGRAAPQVSSFFASEYVAGRYYTLGDGNHVSSVAVAAANRLMLYYADIPRPLNIASMFTRVITGQAGGAFKTGIWRDLNGRPTGAPIAADNAGQASTSASTPVIPLTASLAPGRYWFGTKHTASSTLPTFIAWHGSYIGFASNVGAPTANEAMSNGATNQPTCVYVADTYANNMPDLTGASFTVGAAQGCPVLGVLVA